VGSKFLRDAERKDATALPAFDRDVDGDVDPGADRNASAAAKLTKLAYPRSCRIVRRADFDAVYRTGRRRSSASFAIFYRPNERAVTRFGMSVKKTMGVAVVRNRIRRRVREILRLNRQEIASGWDIVIHPRPAVLSANFGALTAELLKILPK
jgi:ribonuclease P protein component